MIGIIYACPLLIRQFARILLRDFNRQDKMLLHATYATIKKSNVFFFSCPNRNVLLIKRKQICPDLINKNGILRSIYLFRETTLILDRFIAVYTSTLR